MVIAIGVSPSRGARQHRRRRGRQGAAGPRGLRNLLPNLAELKACRFAFLNGSVTGFCSAACPAPRTIASFISYGVEKAVSKHPEQFGQGAPEGVRGHPRAPTMPTPAARWCRAHARHSGRQLDRDHASRRCAVGVKARPADMTETPDVFWGPVCSMISAHVMLLILNLPLVPLFAQILRLPAYILFPCILGISVVGAYGASGRLFDLGLVVAFGLLGYGMGKLKYPTAPLILGFVLGDNMERRCGSR